MSRRTPNAPTSGATAPRVPDSHPEPGPVERQVRADVGALVTAHPMGEALAEMAYSLARTLDEGAGMAAAAVNKELRANLLELASMRESDDDDLDAQLSTPVMPPEVRDPEEP